MGKQIDSRNVHYRSFILPNYIILMPVRFNNVYTMFEVPIVNLVLSLNEYRSTPFVNKFSVSIICTMYLIETLSYAHFFKLYIAWQCIVLLSFLLTLKFQIVYTP